MYLFPMYKLNVFAKFRRRSLCVFRPLTVGFWFSVLLSSIPSIPSIFSALHHRFRRFPVPFFSFSTVVSLVFGVFVCQLGMNEAFNVQYVKGELGKGFLLNIETYWVCKLQFMSKYSKGEVEKNVSLWHWTWLKHTGSVNHDSARARRDSNWRLAPLWCISSVPFTAWERN